MQLTQTPGPLVCPFCVYVSHIGKLQMVVRLRLADHTYPVQFAIALIVILFLDFIWFSSVGQTVYSKVITANDVRLSYGLIAWLPLAVAAAAVSQDASAVEGALYGAAVGFVPYAVFNGTNLSILPDWRAHRWVSCIDILWGATNLAVATSVALATCKGLKNVN